MTEEDNTVWLAGLGALGAAALYMISQLFMNKPPSSSFPSPLPKQSFQAMTPPPSKGCGCGAARK